MAEMFPLQRVGIIGTHVAPAKGYGGVAESTAQLAQAWSARGHNFGLCCSDACQAGQLTVAAVGLPNRIPVRLYHARWRRRWGFGFGALAAILKTCRSADAIYINGIATWPTTLAAMICLVLRRRFVIAPRGGLARGYVKLLFKRISMRTLFYKLITIPSLRRAKVIHATSELEADDVRHLLPETRIEVIGNGLNLLEWPYQPLRSQDGGRIYCYLGRFSPEKGIGRFLRLWLACRRPGDHFLLAGSGDGAYGREIEDVVQAGGEAIRVLGYQDRAGVLATLAACDFLVLPSGIETTIKRESFGNAAAEALAAGRPLLVTRGLAWDHIEAEGVGFLFDSSPLSVQTALIRAAAVTEAELAVMSIAARRYAERHLDVKVTAERVWRMIANGEARLAPTP